MKYYYHATMTQAIIVETDNGEMFLSPTTELKPIDLSKCKPYHGYRESLRSMPDYQAKFYAPAEPVYGTEDHQGDDFFDVK